MLHSVARWIQIFYRFVRFPMVLPEEPHREIGPVCISPSDFNQIAPPCSVYYDKIADKFAKYHTLHVWVDQNLQLPRTRSEFLNQAHDGDHAVHT